MKEGPKIVFSMKCRKSLCLKNTTILRFMYIFTECRKDLCQNSVFYEV